jgi:hypothetical protein
MAIAPLLVVAEAPAPMAMLSLTLAVAPGGPPPIAIERLLLAVVCLPIAMESFAVELGPDPPEPPCPPVPMAIAPIPVATAVLSPETTVEASPAPRFGDMRRIPEITPVFTGCLPKP